MFGLGRPLALKWMENEQSRDSCSFKLTEKRSLIRTPITRVGPHPSKWATIAQKEPLLKQLDGTDESSHFVTSVICPCRMFSGFFTFASTMGNKQSYTLNSGDPKANTNSKTADIMADEIALPSDTSADGILIQSFTDENAPPRENPDIVVTTVTKDVELEKTDLQIDTSSHPVPQDETHEITIKIGEGLNLDETVQSQSSSSGVSVATSHGDYRIDDYPAIGEGVSIGAGGDTINVLERTPSLSTIPLQA
uniref:Uncharacterized protein n=1 Tax=Panagrellus redivivus TaxID=6233 RepID=A0A7E4UN40_PANRE